MITQQKINELFNIQKQCVQIITGQQKSVDVERSHNLDRSFCNIYVVPSFPTRERHAHSVQNARSRFNKLNQSYSC